MFHLGWFLTYKPQAWDDIHSDRGNQFPNPAPYVDFARTLEFTPTELADLQSFSDAGVPGSGQLFTITTTRGPVEQVPVTQYVFDSTRSDWAIPLYRTP